MRWVAFRSGTEFLERMVLGNVFGKIRFPLSGLIPFVYVDALLFQFLLVGMEVAFLRE